VDFGGLKLASAGDLHLAVEALILAVDHRGTGLAGRCPDAARGVAFLPLVAGVVEDAHRGGTRLEAHLDEAFHDGGMRVGGALRRDVPADVGLHDDGLALFDKGAHAAELGDGLVEHGHAVAVTDCHEYGARAGTGGRGLGIGGK